MAIHRNTGPAVRTLIEGYVTLLVESRNATTIPRSVPVQLPNLEGQPGWVVVIVSALFVLGTLGTLHLRRKVGGPEDSLPGEGLPATVTSPDGSHQAFDAVRDAMKHLAASAEREAQNADEAEEEAKLLRQQLADCARARALLEERVSLLNARLEACEQLHRIRRAEDTA